MEWGDVGCIIPSSIVREGGLLSKKRGGNFDETEKEKF